MDRIKAAFIRWRLVAAVYVCCTLYFLFQGGKSSLMLFIILNVLLVYLMLGRWSGIAKVTGERRLVHGASKEHVMPAGTRLEVHLRFRLPGVWPIPYVLVRERLIRQGGKDMPFEVSFVPDFRRQGTVMYLTPPLQRGYYRFAQGICLTRDIFGLLEHTGKFASPATFSVLPQIIPIRTWNQLHRGLKGPFSHAATSRAAKDTTQINGVRDYLYGDRLSRIHWNATAKTGEWKSKEFEREAMPRSILILDRHEPAYAQSEQFELAVSTAASLFEFGMRKETSMGLVSAGANLEGFAARSTPDQRKAVMNHFVGVAADSPLPLYPALRQAARLLTPGSFAVIVSPQGGEETIKAMQWLDRKGLVPSLIYIEGASKDADPESWQRVIRSQGWPIHVVRSLPELPGALEGGGLHATS
ncbi:DUF58 domain-containing protein [Paenibacillaceae bacterium]|nr:DUF58 domain-containing protein [Paenibacillaceae bacterium]